MFGLNNTENFLTSQDKIDEIYILLKKQRRHQIISSIFSWIIRLIILYFILSGYQIFVQNKNPELKTKITNSISDVISSITGPIIDKILQENVSKMGGKNTQNINPEDIQKVIDSMKR